MAKAALVEKSHAERSADGLREQQAAIDSGLEKLDDDIARLEAKLADAKTRQQALVARQQTASRRLEVRKKIHDHRIDDALVRFDHYERRMDDIEGRVEAFDLGSRKDLRQEFSDLEASDSVERELEALKSKRRDASRERTSDDG